jgi:hypothetical protein
MSLVTALLMALGMAQVQPNPGCGCAPAPKPSPVVVPMTADAPQSDAAEGVEAADLLSATAGPFSTYLAAADYADFLELEYGFYTRVVRSGGLYFVIYW